MIEVFCIASTVIFIGMIIVIIVVASNTSKSMNNARESYEQISAQIRKENDKLEEFIAEQSVVSDEDDEEEDDDEYEDDEEDYE